jgi:hypothetical protein
MPLAEIAAHCDAHFAEQAPGAAAAADSGAEVECSICGLAVALGDLDGHELAHSLAEEEGAQLGGGNAPAAAEELRCWEGLRSRYGFSDPKRPGSCYLCGQPGHWVPECPRNPDNVAAQARVIRPPQRAAIAAAQRPDPQWRAAGQKTSVMELIAECIRSEAPPAAGAATTRTLLSAHVQHFGAQRADASWGCGYRNVQMLVSSLLTERPDARAVLFAGAGYVPDIPALQAWLECAWAAGFDPPGAEQLGGALQGTRKWVGTTEAATLLRFFGLHASVVDFGVDAGREPAGAGSASGPDAGTRGPHGGEVSAGEPPAPAGDGCPRFGPTQGALEVHPNVECDGCGVCPVAGPRYRSEVLPGFDLCGACYRLQCHPAAEPFRRVPAPAVGPSGAAAGALGWDSRAGKGTFLGQAVLEWVWRYFSAERDPATKRSGGFEGAGPLGKRSGGFLGPEPRGKRPRPDVEPGGDPPARVEFTSRPPLYFQHEGHSRCIVGVDCSETRGMGGAGVEREYMLLILDPAVAPAALAAALRRRQGWQRLLRRGASTLRHSQYQLMYCAGMPPAPPGSRQYEVLKNLAALESYA